jgi:threonine dehydratase
VTPESDALADHETSRPEASPGDGPGRTAAPGDLGPPVLVERIEEAARVVDPVFTHTPQFVSEALGRAAGATVVVKLETANPIRSFKGRGADFFFRSWDGPADRPVVCASAGNFGQAMAYVARRRRVPLHVVAPTTANPWKLESIRRLGAPVDLAGSDYDEAKATAQGWASNGDATFVEDGVHPAFTEGAGSIAVELAANGPQFDDVVVPVGGGALATGIGRYLHAARPGVRVVGVCATGAPAMARAWETGLAEPAGPVSTIADGIAIREPVPVAVARARAWIDEMLLVDDETMHDAIGLVLSELGILLEPAGAAGLAAVLAHPDRFAGRVVAVPLCGGNIDPSLARAVLDRWSRGAAATGVGAERS